MKLFREMCKGSIKARTLIASAVVMAVWLGAYNGATAAGQTVNPESTIAVYCNPQSSMPDLAKELDLAGGGLIAKCARSGGSRGGGGGPRGGFSPGASYANAMNQITAAWQGAVAAQNAHFNQVEREADRLLSQDSPSNKRSDFAGDNSGRRSTKTTQSGKTHSESKVTVLKPEPAAPTKPTVPSLLDASSGMSKISSATSGPAPGGPSSSPVGTGPAPVATVGGHQASGSDSKHGDKSADQLLQSSTGLKPVASASPSWTPPPVVLQKEDPQDKANEKAWKDYWDKYKELTSEIAQVEKDLQDAQEHERLAQQGYDKVQGVAVSGQLYGSAEERQKALKEASKRLDNANRYVAELKGKLSNLNNRRNGLTKPGGASSSSASTGGQKVTTGTGGGSTDRTSVSSTQGTGTQTTATSGQRGTGAIPPAPGQQSTFYDPTTDTIGIYTADKDGNFSKVRDLEVGEEFVDGEGDRRIYDGAGGGRLKDDWDRQKATNDKYESDRLSDPRDQGTAPSEFFNDFTEKTKEAEELLNALTQLFEFIRNAPPGVSPSARDFVTRQIPDYNTAKTDPEKVKKVMEAVKKVVQGDREKEVAQEEEKDAFWSEAIRRAELAKLAGKIAGQYLGYKAVSAIVKAALGAQEGALVAERMAKLAKEERDAARAAQALNKVSEAQAKAQDAFHKAKMAQDALKPPLQVPQSTMNKWAADAAKKSGELQQTLRDVFTKPKPRF